MQRESKQSYTKMSKKQQKECEEKLISEFKQKMKTNFKEEILEDIYKIEQPKLATYIGNKIGAAEYQAGDRELNKEERKKIKNSLSYKEIELCLPNSTKYMADRVWHGYDSKYYVSS